MSRFKRLLCPFCLRSDKERGALDDQDNDVSHLAEPQVSLDVSSGNIESQSHSSSRRSNQQPDNEDASATPNEDTRRRHSTPSSSTDQIPLQTASTSRQQQPTEQLDRTNQHSSSSSLPSNFYESPSNSSNVAVRQNDLQRQPQGRYLSSQHVQRAGETSSVRSTSNKPVVKLSYDIISVREPLAKVLANQQQQEQLKQNRAQQSQTNGDHDYIEVYGERGSSCFYEEIAGSTASSVTYDQIDGQSNHNYQALLTSRTEHQENSNRLVPHCANVQPPNNVTIEESTDHLPQPTNILDTRLNNDQNQTTTKPPNLANEINQNQSVPVYSVINKASKSTKKPLKPVNGHSKPPQPPPKNSPMLQQPSTSRSIPTYEELSPASIQPQLPTDAGQTVTSSNLYTSISKLRTKNTHIDGAQSCADNSPEPPPRLKKQLPSPNQSAHHTSANRPLPSPDSLNNNNSYVSNRNIKRKDCDLNSDNNNEYELLESKFDDEQTDVGYEKIGESTRPVGSRLSGQFCPMRALDNDGYESLQPIYASPSNTLAEPNYEAIDPSSASELIAAAAVRLSAAATNIDPANN